MTPSAILRAAADTLRTHGWCQDRMVAANGRRCAIGAIEFVSKDRDETSAPALDLLRDYLNVGLISDWNDTPGRTAEEVIAALEAAASSTENQQ